MTVKEKPKPKGAPQRPLIRFIAKNAPRLFVGSILSFVAYVVVTAIVFRLVPDDKVVYWYPTLWVIWASVMGFLISSLMYLFIQPLQGATMLLLGAVALICMLAFVGPTVSFYQLSYASVVHDGYRYRVVQQMQDSSLSSVLLRCDSLGIVCDEPLTTVNMLLWTLRNEGQTIRLEYNPDTDSIDLSDGNEVVFSHPLSE